MLDVEPVIKSELGRLAAAPAPASDWSDVLVRSRSESRSAHHLLLVAAAALLGMAIIAAAIAATFGGFRGWLTGEPGAPASPRAQQAFENATRSWRGFPRSTQLRRLVTADVNGVHYELDGFRGAGSLCLRLVASGSASATRLDCAPLAALRASKAPALVLATDSSIGTSGTVSNGPLTFARPVSAVTFGVLADGVQRIEITHRRTSPTKLFVSGDAFLAVSPRLSPFNVTTKIVASAGTAHAPVPFAPGGTPFSPPTPLALPKPTGPTSIQRRVASGAIRWFARREPRGTVVPPNVHHIVGTSPHVIFARMITPDPGQPERIVVSISPAGQRYFGGRLRNNHQMCAELVGGRYQGGGCWPAGRLFSTAPFTFGMFVQRGGQVMTIAGLVDDDVAKLELFPAIGVPRTLTTHDNGYFAAATLADFPVRLVAYDRGGLIIGSKILNGPFETAPIPPFSTPAAGAKWKKVLANASGSVWEVRSTSGGVCLAFKEGGGTGMGCDETVTPRGLTLSVGSDRSHSYVQGLAGSRIRTLLLTLRNGRVIVVGPVHRYVLYRLAKSALRDSGYTVKRIDGLDARGHMIVSHHYG
jgi:hypothetical protein